MMMTTWKRIGSLLLTLSLPFSLWAAHSPFKKGTEALRSPNVAQFGEELQADLDLAALNLALGTGSFRMEGLPLSDGRLVDLDLTHFSPFTPGATVVAMTDSGPVASPPNPDRRYFKGSMPFHPESAAVFVFWSDGFSGFLDLDGQRYIYGISSGAGRGLKACVTRFDPTLHPENYRTCDNEEKPELTEVPPSLRPEGLAPRVPSTGTLKAELALDMDYEAYTYFGSVANAADYAADLTAAISIFYERDANTIIAIKQVTVWTSIAAPYPYTGGTTSALLDQIKAYYVANMGGVVRATAHLLSKKSLGGGIAWRSDGGLLCNNSWAYGVNGINGSYTYPTTAYTWDADCFAHELGHNFGSKHTHCYFVSGSWLDCCYASEASCCPGPATNVRGTIMSYCHLQPAGKDLAFGAYVSPIIRTGAVNGACVLEAGSPGTISGNAAYWNTDGLKITKQTAPVAVSLLLDDGGYWGAFGYYGTGQIAIINRFTPSQYPVTLDRLDILFGNSSVAAGRAIRLLVYKDAAGTGNPANSTLAYTQDTTIQVVSTSTWNQYALTTPQTVSSGDVYIGVYDLVADSADTLFAPVDGAAALSRSYFKANSTTPSGYTLYATSNWMIRASGTRSPGGDDLLLTWGNPCNSGWQPGQKYAVYQDAISQLAIEGYNPAPLDCAVDAQSKTYTIPGAVYFTVVPIVGPNEGGHNFSRPAPTTKCGTIDPDPTCP